MILLVQVHNCLFSLKETFFVIYYYPTLLQKRGYIVSLHHFLSIEVFFLYHSLLN